MEERFCLFKKKNPLITISGFTRVAGSSPSLNARPPGGAVDCKTVRFFFLKVSKEMGKACRKSLTRAKRASRACEARVKNNHFWFHEGGWW